MNSKTLKYGAERPGRAYGLYVGFLFNQTTRLKLHTPITWPFIAPLATQRPRSSLRRTRRARTRPPWRPCLLHDLSNRLLRESRSSVLPAATSNGLTIHAAATSPQPPARAARHAGLVSGREREHVHTYHPAEPTTIPRTWPHRHPSLTQTLPKHKLTNSNNKARTRPRS